VRRDERLRAPRVVELDLGDDQAGQRAVVDVEFDQVAVVSVQSMPGLLHAGTLGRWPQRLELVCAQRHLVLAADHAAAGLDGEHVLLSAVAHARLGAV